MKVGGKRFPRRGNRRRPPKAACGAPLKAELLPPSPRLPLSPRQQAAQSAIRSLLRRADKHGLRLKFKPVICISCLSIRLSQKLTLLQGRIIREIMRSKGTRFCSAASDQKARLSSRGGTAKRFSSRKPPQATYGGLRPCGSASEPQVLPFAR